MNKTDRYQNDAPSDTVVKTVLLLSLVGLLAVVAVPLVGEQPYEVGPSAAAPIPEAGDSRAVGAQLALPEPSVPSATLATSAMQDDVPPARF